MKTYQNLTKLVFLLLISISSIAQNVGINAPFPTTSLDMTGAIRIRNEVVVGTGGSTIAIPANMGHVIITGAFSGPFTATIAGEKGQKLVIENKSDFEGILEGTAAIKLGINEYVNSGGVWFETIGSSSSSGGFSWNILGNSGTDPAVNFIGNQDGAMLNFRTNNLQRMQIIKDGQIGIGVNADAYSKFKLEHSKEIVGIDIYSSVQDTEIEKSYGIRVINSSKNLNDAIGGHFESKGFNPMSGGRNIGVSAVSNNSANYNIGLYASAGDPGISSNLAAHFDNGNVKISNFLSIFGSLQNLGVLEVYRRPSRHMAYFDMPTSGKTNNVTIGYRINDNDLVGIRIDNRNTPSNRALEVLGKTFFDGPVGVLTATVPVGYDMAINGKLIAEELRIQNSTLWPDYVFTKEYKLPKLTDVEQHILAKKHLPNVPSAAEVAETGIIVGEMQKTLLRKIEELTLYIIEQEKRIQALENAKK